MESIDQIQSDLRNSQNFENQIQIKKEKFQIVNKIGIIYAIGIAFIYQFAQIYSTICGHFFPKFLKENREDYILLATLILNQICGTLLMFILTKFIKSMQIKKYKYGYKKYLANLCINSGLLIVGSLIGYFVDFYFITIFIKKSEEEKSKIISDKSFSKSNIFLNILVVCFTGPIAEEFIFRKFLIDRLSIYSKTLAIFSSGILFGIFHINLHQLFGAMFLGWSLAYSYAETGNILISISYHMIANITTTITQAFNPYDYNENQNKIGAIIIIVILILRLIVALIGIILLLVYRKKIKIRNEENNHKDKWKIFKSYGMWIYIFEGFILFCIYYLNIFF